MQTQPIPFARAEMAAWVKNGMRCNFSWRFTVPVDIHPYRDAIANHH